MTHSQSSYNPNILAILWSHHYEIDLGRLKKKPWHIIGNLQCSLKRFFISHIKTYTNSSSYLPDSFVHFSQMFWLPSLIWQDYNYGLQGQHYCQRSKWVKKFIAKVPTIHKHFAVFFFLLLLFTAYLCVQKYRPVNSRKSLHSFNAHYHKNSLRIHLHLLKLYKIYSWTNHTLYNSYICANLHF